jgi:hypothetical protein
MVAFGLNIVPGILRNQAFLFHYFKFAVIWRNLLRLSSLRNDAVLKREPFA